MSRGRCFWSQFPPMAVEREKTKARFQNSHRVQPRIDVCDVVEVGHELPDERAVGQREDLGALIVFFAFWFLMGEAIEWGWAIERARTLFSLSLPLESNHSRSYRRQSPWMRAVKPQLQS